MITQVDNWDEHPMEYNEGWTCRLCHHWQRFTPWMIKNWTSPMVAYCEECERSHLFLMGVLQQED